MDIFLLLINANKFINLIILVDMDTYYTEGIFDVNKFNEDYKKQQERMLNEQRQSEFNELRKKEVRNTLPINKSIGEILIEIKNAWFGVFGDVVTFKWRRDILTKENRLFYIGLTIVICTMIFLIVRMFMNTDNPTKQKPDKLIEIHHIYHGKNSDVQNLAKPLNPPTSENSSD